MAQKISKGVRFSTETVEKIFSYMYAKDIESFSKAVNDICTENLSDIDISKMKIVKKSDEEIQLEVQRNFEINRIGNNINQIAKALNSIQKSKYPIISEKPFLKLIEIVEKISVNIDGLRGEL